MEQPVESRVASAADQHARLIELASDTRPVDVQAVLNLGAAVVLHGLVEPTHLGTVLQLVDPSVRLDLERDHAELGADLALLAETHRAGDVPEDAEALSASLLARLRAHVDRDERTLYRPLGRLQQLPRSGSQEKGR